MNLQKHRLTICKILVISFIFSSITGVIIFFCGGEGFCRSGVKMSTIKGFHGWINMIFLIAVFLHATINRKALIKAMRE